MAKTRQTVVFSGRVQGVGFRYSTCHVAERFDVVGYVRNLSDGRVELVAEGEPDYVGAFVAGVNKAMAGYISDTQETHGQPSGEFTRFGILY